MPRYEYYCDTANVRQELRCRSASMTKACLPARSATAKIFTRW
jgi:hypothetical protein